MRPWLPVSALLLLAAASAAARQSPVPASDVTTSVVVTVMPKHGDAVPDVPLPDVLVSQGKQRAIVTGWQRLTPAPGGLEIYIAIDDDARYFGDRQPELRDFIHALPANAAVGLAYLRNGDALIVQNPIPDHDRVAAEVRLPVGSPGISPSPYESVMDLIAKWTPRNGVNREVVLVSDGIEHLLGNQPDNPMLLKAIATAQSGHVVVFGIYATGAADGGADITHASELGQSNLLEFATRTGGNAYYPPGDSPASYRSFFQDISRRLQDQYLLTFALAPPPKAALVPLRVQLETANTQVTAPAQIQLP